MKRLKSSPWPTRMFATLFIFALIPLYLDFGLFLRPVPADFNQAMEQELNALKAPGAVFLALRDGQISFTHSYGSADPTSTDGQTARPVTADTLFTIASLSKPVTATALMTLFEQDRFALDDDINAYLPFPVRSPHFPDQPITFRMLLAHTSGIQDSSVVDELYTLYSQPVAADSPIALGDFLGDYLTPGGAYYDANENFTQAAPGAEYHYTNTGFALVGYLVEQISGQPFDQYCRQALFEPLGMEHSAWFFRDVDLEQMAVPYSYNSLLRQPVRIGFYGFPTYPDGALKTSANEMARFLAIFLNNGQTLDGRPFLRPETIQEMLRVQFPAAHPKQVIAWEQSGATYMHTGGDEGMLTMAVIKPANRTGFLIFTNTDGGDKMVLGTVRLQLFLNRIKPLLRTYLADE